MKRPSLRTNDLSAGVSTGRVGLAGRRPTLSISYLNPVEPFFVTASRR